MFRSVTSAQASGVTALVVTRPTTGVVVGDVMIASLSARDTADTNGAQMGEIRDDANVYAAVERVEQGCVQ